MPAIKILFVCTGNICRSPTAEGLFKEQVKLAGIEKKVVIDSAGTHAWCEGDPPDSFAQTALQVKGIDISHQRSRKITLQDYDYFDLILAADHFNEANLMAECNSSNRHKIKMLMSYAPKLGTTEITDPYGGGMHGFSNALKMIERACAGLLKEIQSNLFIAHDR
jgi:protein-tyrosine phosphatase